MKFSSFVVICLVGSVGFVSSLELASAGPKPSIRKPGPTLPPKRTISPQQDAQNRARAEAARRNRIDAQIKKHTDEIAGGKK
jgi:hypothetical protein